MNDDQAINRQSVGKLLVTLLLVSGFVFAPTAGAANADREVAGHLPIEVTASDHAAFFGYWSEPREQGLTIRGKLRRSPVHAHSLLGSIRVRLLDDEHRVLREFRVQPRRFPLKRRLHRFSIELADIPAATAAIHLSHQV